MSMTMTLQDAPAIPMLVTDDIGKSRAFWRDIIGLYETREAPGQTMVQFEAGGGTRFMIYEREQPSHADHTEMVFAVPDVAAAVEVLRGRGVRFEEYDQPGLKTENGIATMDGRSSAWFKDPGGNIIGVVTR